MSKRRKGVKFTLEHRKNLSLSNGNRGEKSHFWKGGITEINTKIRQGFEYRLWREAVFKRDKYTCVLCGAKNGSGKTVYLEADHIKPFSLSRIEV